MEKDPKQTIIDLFNLNEKFLERDQAKAAHKKAFNAVKRVQANINKMNGEISHLKDSNLKAISEGDFDDKITAKIGGLRLQIEQASSILPDLQDIENSTNERLQALELQVLEQITPEVQRVMDLVRKIVTSQITNACDIAESWTSSVAEIYNRAGLKLRGYEAGSIRILDLENRLMPRIDRLR